MATKDYLSCAETAKLVRQTLKVEFPGVKFSVRSKTYSGGASISVYWTDGPTAESVRAVTQLYTGASFDGMIDLKSYHDSILVDSDGNPQVVHFGADFIFEHREMSDKREAVLRAELEFFTGQRFEFPEKGSRYADPIVKMVKPSHYGNEYVSAGHYGDSAGQLSCTSQPHDSYYWRLLQMMGGPRRWYGEACPSSGETWKAYTDSLYCPTCGAYVPTVGGTTIGFHLR